MSTSYLNIYCDESGIERGTSFYFGALICSLRRAEILEEEISIFRRQYGCIREMKWTKVSKHMLEAYTTFADVFFNDPFCYFRILEVQCGNFWKEWGPNEENRFFKSYYVFLRKNMSPMCRYGVYLDYKPGKPYCWNQLYFSINNAGKRDYELRQKQIHTLKALNSKASNLIQLVDVLLGASVSSAVAPAKNKLAEHVRYRSNEATRTGKLKIFQESWAPPRIKSANKPMHGTSVASLHRP